MDSLSYVCFCHFVRSASTSNVAKLEEMERLLREAQAEKRSLLEHKVIMRSSYDYAHLFFVFCFFKGPVLCVYTNINSNVCP